MTCTVFIFCMYIPNIKHFQVHLHCWPLCDPNDGVGGKIWCFTSRAYFTVLSIIQRYTLKLCLCLFDDLSHMKVSYWYYSEINGYCPCLSQLSHKQGIFTGGDWKRARKVEDIFHRGAWESLQCDQLLL